MKNDWLCVTELRFKISQGLLSSYTSIEYLFKLKIGKLFLSASNTIDTCGKESGLTYKIFISLSDIT